MPEEVSYKSELTVKIIGKIIEKEPMKTVGKKNTDMTTIVVEEVEGKYPNVFQIQLFKERAYSADKMFEVGDVVRVRGEVGGKKWKKDKDHIYHFTSITGWSIKPADQAESTPSNNTQKEEVPEEKQSKIEEEDDLPF